MASDMEIIQAVIGGQSQRYAELVDRYQRAAVKVAYGFVRNYEDARELSQNGFVKAYQHLRTFKGKSKFSTWLYRIIVNECKDFLKRGARTPTVVSLSSDPGTPEDSGMFEVADPGGSPSDALEQCELAKRITHAIDQLPMKQRTAFVLHHVHGLSLEEAAQVMKCRVGTVKSHIFRASERLRITLQTAASTIITSTGVRP